VNERILDKEDCRELYERILYSQTFSRTDTWKEHAEGADQQEYTPLKIA
jgi:NAD(P)H-nitrite reductase large subunit